MKRSYHLKMFYVCSVNNEQNDDTKLTAFTNNISAKLVVTLAITMLHN